MCIWLYLILVLLTFFDFYKTQMMRMVLMFHEHHLVGLNSRV